MIGFCSGLLRHSHKHFSACFKFSVEMKFPITSQWGKNINLMQIF